MRRAMLSLSVCVIVGCGKPSGVEIVPLEKVPEQTMKKAKEALPDVQFATAVRRSDGGLEIRGKDARGNIRDVDFSVEGNVIEIE